MPSIGEVDDYLAVLKSQPARPQLLPGVPIGCGSHGIGPGYVELRKKHMAAMERVKPKIDQIDAERLQRAELRRQLRRYGKRPLKIGAFSACSNVTGIFTPYHEMARLVLAEQLYRAWSIISHHPYHR